MKDNIGVIYPVGIKDVFERLWKIDSYFGEKRSNTWYHSGDDFNLKTGGNTDLNTPLLAIADGKILTTYNGRVGFGKQLVLEFILKGIKYYALYCHLNGFDVKEGDTVTKGQQICRLGSTGNSEYAHLHFSIKNTANGLTNIPNNKEELKQWENPLQFISEHYKEGSEEPNNMQENLQELFGVKTIDELKIVWDREMSFLKDAREKIDILKEEKSQSSMIYDLRRESLAKNLGTIIDWDSIILASSRFRGLDDKNRELEDKLDRQQKEHSIAIAEYEARLNSLKTEMNDLKASHAKQIENIEKRVDDEIAGLQKQKEQYETVSKLIEWIKNLFGKKK